MKCTAELFNTTKMSLITPSDFADVEFCYNASARKAYESRMEYFADEAIDYFSKYIDENRHTILSNLCKCGQDMGKTSVRSLDVVLKQFVITRPSKAATLERRHEIRELIDYNLEHNKGVYYESPILKQRCDLLEIIKKTTFIRRLEAVISDDPRIYLWFKIDETELYNDAEEITCSLYLCMRMRGEIPQRAATVRNLFVNKLNAIRSQVTY